MGVGAKRAEFYFQLCCQVSVWSWTNGFACPCLFPHLTEGDKWYQTAFVKHFEVYGGKALCSAKGKWYDKSFDLCIVSLAIYVVVSRTLAASHLWTLFLAPCVVRWHSYVIHLSSLLVSAHLSGHPYCHISCLCTILPVYLWFVTRCIRWSVTCLMFLGSSVFETSVIPLYHLLQCCILSLSVLSLGLHLTQCLHLSGHLYGFRWYLFFLLSSQDWSLSAGRISPAASWCSPEKYQA